MESKGKRPALGRGLSALISSPVPVSLKSRIANQPSTAPLPASQGTSGGNAALKIEPNEVASFRIPLPTSSAGVSEPFSAPLGSPSIDISPMEASPSPLADAAESDSALPAALGIQYLPISVISPNPKQPRQLFLETELDELADSIRTLGVLQPILVRPVAGAAARYEIVAGERRWRASQRAGLDSVPVVVRSLDDRETLEISIVENVQRADLNPIEEARAYHRLAEEFNLSQQEIAEKVGKDRATVANSIRLLKLSPEVLELLRKGELSMGHARALLAIKDPTAQTSLAKKAVADALSVRAIEELVSRAVVLDAGKTMASDSTRRLGATERQFPELLDRLRAALGTKVQLRHGASGKGKIIVEYFSEAELDRLIERLTR